MKISFTKKEIFDLILSAGILGFVFGFDDGRDVFIARLWFANFIRLAALSLIVLSIMVLSHKWAAGRYSIKAEYKMWYISRYWFRERDYIQFKKPLHRIPLGIIAPILIAIFSEGKFWLASVGMIMLSMRPEHRVGKKWIQIADYEEARIAFAGPVSIMITMILFGLFFQSSGLEIWKHLIFICLAVLISHMLPFPQLAGGRMLCTSLYLFIFALALTIATSILILFIPTMSMLLMALVFAIVIVTAVYFQQEVLAK